MTVYEGIIIDVEPWVVLPMFYSDVWLASTGVLYEGYVLKFGEDPVPIERPSDDLPASWLGTWAHRVPIVIDHTRVDENIFDYPLLISLNDTMQSGTRDSSQSELLNLDFNSGSIDDDWEDNSDTNTISYSSGRMVLHTTGTTSAYAAANATSDGNWPVDGRYILEFDWYPVNGSDWYDDDGSDSEHFIQFVGFVPVFNPNAWAYNEVSSPRINIRLRSSKSNTINLGSQSKSFTYGIYHKVKIELDCVSGVIYLYMDDVFQLSDSIAANLSDIGSVFRFNFHWHNYGRTTDQEYDNMTLTKIIDTPYPYKVAVTKSDGVSQLPVEIISYRDYDQNPTYATKIPKLFAAEDIKLYLYYDKAQPDNVEYVGATRDLIAQTVWDSNYISVVNLSDDLNTTTIKDSTSVGSNGTATSLSAARSVEGLVGHAIDFDGSSDSISFTHTSYMSVRDNGMTFEYLVTPKSYSSGARLFQQGYYDGFHTNIGTSGNLSFGIDSSGWYGWTSHFVVPLNEPSYLVIIVDDNNEIKFYLNGQTSALDVQSYSYDTPDQTTSIAIGAQTYGTDTNHFEGEIDFFRRSIGKRSDAWIKATNYNITGQLYTIGDEENKVAYYYHGYVTQLDLPAARQVRLYHRDSGDLMDETTSDVSTGYYYLTTSVSGSHYVVVLDDDAGDDYNALISDRLGPLGIE